MAGITRRHCIAGRALDTGPATRCVGGAYFVSTQVPPATYPWRDPAGARACFAKHMMGASLCVSVGLMLASIVFATPGSALLVRTTSASVTHESVHNPFAAIENRAMPGLPPANWPTLQFVGSPPGVRDTANVGSNDLKYTVTFYDFRSRAAATAFYDAPPGSMLSFLRGAEGYSSLGGPTGIPAPSRGLDLRSCIGEGSGVVLFPTGQCSNGSQSFSIGVGTIAQVGPVILMVGYVRNNTLTKAANSSELGHNVKVALSGVSLLRSIGISSR